MSERRPSRHRTDEPAHTRTESHPSAHLHGALDPAFFAARSGIEAVGWSFVALGATTLVQGFIALHSGSAALLADAVHNLGDASTSVPLWIAFRLARLKPSERFTYGYGRMEDLAGLAVVAAILTSAAAAAWISVDRFLHPREVTHLAAVMAGSLVGLLGNEGVAVLRIRVGKRIGSAALTADGYHARADGLASLAVLLGALGVWAGYPVADPLIGILISLFIFKIGVESAGTVFTRLLDGVDPEVFDEIRKAAAGSTGVRGIGEIRARWSGHRLHAEANVAVDPSLSVERGHRVAMEVRHRLMHALPYLSNVVVHVDTTEQSGEEHHRIAGHRHGDLPEHGH